MSPLTHKLLRDLWVMKGQATAIGAVIAMGVMMLVMMTGLVASLDETRRAYYERYRLADVFAPVERAPVHVLRRIRELPGVARVEGRVVGSALINLPGIALPLQAQALSLPDFREPGVNDIYLTAGRRLDSARPGEILLLESFATSHELRPGDVLSATMNGARRSFRIVGLAQSPEFLYSTAPGELVPDDSRFGVMWMSRSSLEAAYDMQGAFNEAVLSLSRGAEPQAILADLDRLLERYGGFGAYALKDQFSNTFITQEIEGMRAASAGVPPVFLAVAAFLLYIVVGRIVQAEREEIGLMKAFGYSNAEVGAHYFRMVLVIATGGALAGCLLGVLAGRALIGVYTEYYKFPFLVFELDPASFVTGVGVSILAASAGGLFVLRRVFALTPSEAMRPPAPADYSGSSRFNPNIKRLLDQPSRMVLRRLTRQPGRMAGAIVGIAAGMALSAAMISIFAGFQQTLDLTFQVVDRSDATVTFTHPVSNRAVFEMQRLPGVLLVEPTRTVRAILHNGVHSHRGAITGLPPQPRLSRAINANHDPIEMPRDGIVLASALADILRVKEGDILTVDVREGRQPLLRIPVAAIAETLLGSPIYMDMSALNRALGEPHRISGAYLALDPARAQDAYRRLKDMPAVAGVSLKEDAEAAFTEIMNTGAGAIRYVMGSIAFVITFGIVYNSARIAYAERARDLASLRVLGFTKAEVTFVLLGELAVVTLVALPIGALAGYYLSIAIARGFSTELYQIPAVLDPASLGAAALVVLTAALASGFLVKLRLDRADLVSTLKTRE